MKKYWNIYSKILLTISAIISFVVLGSQKPVQAEEKTYVTGTDTTFAPFEFQDTNGDFVGIDMDLLKEIAELEGFKVEIKALGFNAALQALESNQIDGMIAGMSITDERKAKFDFSESYFDSGVGMAVAAESTISTYEDLKGKTVAAKIGTQGATFAESIKDKYGFTITTFEDSANMYEDVISGNSVAAFEDYPVMGYAIKSASLPLRLTDYLEEANQYGFAVSKGKNAELLADFNAGLAKLKANGRYDEIINKYISTAEASSEDTSFLGLIKTNMPALAKGLWTTLWITLISISIALIIGIALGLMKTSHITALEWIATIYIDIMRGIPLIVLAFFIYFGIPQLLGIRFDAITAGILTLSLNAAAYVGEIVRGGINAVDGGQSEAALSLGLPYKISMVKVILPQAFRIMIPSFINQFVITLKDTSILSIIGLVELTQTGKIIIARNLQSSSVWLIVGIMYLVIITILTKLSSRLERNI